jgi:hypothetical protein
MDDPTADLQLHLASVIQECRPVHGQTHFLTWKERLLGGEADLATAYFERFAKTHD